MACDTRKQAWFGEIETRGHLPTKNGKEGVYVRVRKTALQAPETGLSYSDRLARGRTCGGRGARCGAVRSRRRSRAFLNRHLGLVGTQQDLGCSVSVELARAERFVVVSRATRTAHMPRSSVRWAGRLLPREPSGLRQPVSQHSGYHARPVRVAEAEPTPAAAPRGRRERAFHGAAQRSILELCLAMWARLVAPSSSPV
jgi:hypothetical protein